MINYAAFVSLIGFILLLNVGDAHAESTAAYRQHSRIEFSIPDGINRTDRAIGYITLKLDEGWHTYWRNPGDAGLPPVFKITNKSLAIDEIIYPVPRRIPEPPLLTYGYKDNVTFPVIIKSKQPLENDERTLLLEAEWLVCKEICIPESALLTLEVPVTENAFQRPAPFITNFKSEAVYSQQGDKIVIELQNVEKGTKAYFYPYAVGGFSHQPIQKNTYTQNALQIELPLKKPIEGSVQGVLQLGDDYYKVTANPGIVETSAKLWQAVVFALLGGLVLNIMPCVFPVLALKIAGVIRGERHIRESLLYTLGIISTFFVLAATLMLLQQQAGWGFQLQQPVFVAFLMLLFVAIALNLWGVWQVPSMRFNRLERATLKSSDSSHFLTGILAVLVATPCTVPFMGAALGYAFSQPPLITFVIFTALGIGLALPYIVVTLLPAKWLSKIPKSGNWLLGFKQLMAFPMLATAIWLCWVLASQTAAYGVVRGLSACLLLGFLFWLMRYKGWWFIKLIVVVALLWTATSVRPTVLNTSALEFSEFSTQDFSRMAAEQNRPIFVNVTASWCITCQLNEKAVLSRAKTIELLAAHKVLYIKADWTFKDKAITKYLTKLNRAGVPTYVVYRPGEKPVILPELLRHKQLADLFNGS